MPDRDAVLLETVRTHRLRLLAAFLFGPLTARRVANDNVRRFAGGIVLTAVACAGCVGFSLVSSILANQATAARAQAGQGPASGTPFVADAFDRTQPAGWGSAETGGRWTTLPPASGYAVSGGAGTLALHGDVPRGGYLGSQLRDRTDLTVTILRTTAAGQGTVEVDVTGRRVSSTEAYEAAVQVAGDGTTSLVLRRRAPDREASEPTVAALSDTVRLLGPARAAGAAATPLSVRLQVVGSAPTTLRAKVWPADSGEPQDWTVSASDSTSVLQRPGAVGLQARRTSDDPGVAGLSVLDLVARPAA